MTRPTTPRDRLEHDEQVEAPSRSKSLFEHDLLGKPLRTLRSRGPSGPDHALSAAVAEQRRKLLLALAAEIDDAAAGSCIARRPFQLREALHQCRAEGAGEVMAPLAPVETGLADRAARMREHFGPDLQLLGEKSCALGGQL